MALGFIPTLSDQRRGVYCWRTYSEKYKAMGYEPAPDTWATGGLWVVQPRLAFAWTKFPEDATRWVFE